MPRRNTLLSCAALLVTISAGAATSAHAQLGKLKKIGVDAAKDAALGKKPEPAKDPAAARITYDITTERLNAIVAALTPRLADAERQMVILQKEREAKAVSAEYQTALKASTDCLAKSMTGQPDFSATQSPKYEALMKRSDAAGKRATSASAAKRTREYLAASDTAMVLSMQLSAMMFKHSCPTMPFKPNALVEAEAAQMDQGAAAQGDGNSNGELDVAPGARAGMTHGQWGRVRERLACWLLIQSGDLPATAEKFTDAEQALLSERAAEIKKFGPVFKYGAMQWVTWYDVKSW